MVDVPSASLLLFGIMPCGVWNKEMMIGCTPIYPIIKACGLKWEILEEKSEL